MKQHAPEYYLKFIQRYLNEISMCGPEQHVRVEVLHKKAIKMLNRLKREHPDFKIVPPSPEGGNVRRVPSSDLGV